MDDQMTEDILKRSKARFEELERMTNSPNVTDDNFESFDSSMEYGIQTFKDKSSLIKENTPQKDNCENCPPTPFLDKFISAPAVSTVNTTTISNKAEIKLSNAVLNGASVKALRNRWEEIAKSECSPLVTSQTKCVTNTKFVSPATTIDQAFAFIGQNHEYSVSPPSKVLSYENYSSDFKNKKIPFVLDSCDSGKDNRNDVKNKSIPFVLDSCDSGKDNRNDVMNKSIPFELNSCDGEKDGIDLTSPLSIVLSTTELNKEHALPTQSLKRNAAPEPPSQLNLNYRPITPNSEVLGSLLDDINNDLEKYRGSDANFSFGKDFSDSATGGLHHTISFYRRQGRNRRSDLPVTELGSIKIPTEPSTSNSLNSSNTSSDIPSNDATLKRLHEQMIVQQDQICQASRALSYCRQTEHFKGSREEIDAQRALLIATERRRAYCLERDRVISARQGITESDASEPRGTLAFSYIAVRLSRDFINMYIQQHSESRNYHFIVLIKCGEHVLHTSLVDSNQSIKSGFVEFSHYIQLSGLVADFICTIEVYGLRVSPNGTLSDKSKRKTIKKIVGAPFGSGNGDASTLNGPRGGLVGIMDSGFQKLGYVTINWSCFGRERFLLSETLYPLDGNIILKMRCFAEQTYTLDYRGFLSLYQIVSGLGSWTRFWCVLGSGQMNFWRYPEDEERKVPSVTLDLTKCLTNVSEAPSSVASFPNSMQVDVAIHMGNNPAEEIRMLFAADTADEMNAWIEAMNKAIRHTNMWNCYPVEASTTTCSLSSTSSSGVSSAATKIRP